jgi:hypothetical protein
LSQCLLFPTKALIILQLILGHHLPRHSHLLSWPCSMVSQDWELQGMPTVLQVSSGLFSFSRPHPSTFPALAPRDPFWRPHFLNSS